MKLTNSFHGCIKRISLLLCIMFCCVATVWAQKTVTGTVVDNLGDPVIGANVLIKGTTRGVTTDIDGKFSINNVSENDILHVTFIGYAAQDLPVAGKNQLSIKLEEENDLLDEVVVIGFGTVKKRDLTGSVASIKAENITQAPTSDVATSLQGRISGLDVNNGELRIRGNRSINGKNDPLVIIDGVQGGSMGDINPSDIESIDVLKDASSTAIYGSQGANGVIIITTKKAEAGKTSITYDGSATGAFRPEHPEYRHGENWYNAAKQAAVNAGMWSSSADDRSLFSSDEAFAAYNAGVWTNYEDLLQKNTTWSQKHSVTISGGNDKTSARISLGYANNGSKWEDSHGSDRYTLRANIDHKLYKWVSAGVNFQLTHNRNEASVYEKATTTKYELGNPYGYVDELGNYKVGQELVERPLAADEYVNPLIDASGDYLYAAKSYGTNVVANGYLDVHPIEGLSFRTQFNTHITNYSYGNYTDANSAANTEKTGQKSVANMNKNSGLYMEWNNVLNYNFKMLPKDHHLGVTLITSYGKSIKDELSAKSVGQTLPSNLWWNLSSNDGADGSSTHGSSYTQSQSLSFAGRVSYDYKGRYLLTASVRRDGASRLADGHKWDSFPSAALAWRLSDEGFMSETKSWLDDLKLRATYGVTGNSGIGIYGTKSGITFANWSFGFQDTAANRYILGTLDNNGSGYYVVANTDTKWEKSATWDLGFDATFLNSRLNVVFDWYNTSTTDLILLRSLPTSSGMDGKYATYTNIGSTENRGVEFSINTRNIVKKNFSWNSGITFSANREKIVDLVEGTDITIGTSKETQTLMIGHPIKSYNTFEYVGIWKSSEADEAAIFGQVPGDVHVAIPNMQRTGDGQYTKYDKEGNVVGVYDKSNPYQISQSEDIGYVGSTSPKWFAGFNNDFKIYDFDVNLYFYARWGQWATNRMANYTPSNGGQYENMDSWVKDSNEDALLPQSYKGRNFYDYTGYQSLWYADNSFLKLKRFTVGYTVPSKYTKKYFVSKLRAYCTVNDPFYFVKSDFQKGYDPENNQRSITFGLNLNF